MSRPLIIGIHGKARSGKDTSAALLRAMVGGYQYSFASPLYAMIAAGLGIDINDPYWKEHKESPIPAYGGKSLRQIVQTLGTQWGRNMICEDIWVQRAMQVLSARGPGMIVSDVRYENEAAFVRRMGGVVIHLRRKDIPRINPHDSENGIQIEPSDFIVDNNGSIDDLEHRLFELFGSNS